MKMNAKLVNPRKIKLRREFPKMLWLGEYSLYEKAIFTKNYNEFLYVINQFSDELFRTTLRN